MGALSYTDCQLASRSVLKDFTDVKMTISAGSLFQNGTARTCLFVELIGVAA